MLVRRKRRWREEDFLKYASEDYGIDKICDYAAITEVNTKVIDNPARKAANAAIRDASRDHTHALFARTIGSRWRSRPRSSLWGARNLAPQKDDRLHFSSFQNDLVRALVGPPDGAVRRSTDHLSRIS